MSKKLTIAEKYTLVLEKADSVLPDDLKDFLRERKEMALAKNANHKPTKVQEANEVIKNDLIKAMEDGKTYTVTDLIKSVAVCAEMTNQKLSALLRQLVADGKVKRVEVKGRAYFSKVSQ